MVDKTFKKDSESLKPASLSRYPWRKRLSIYLIDSFLYPLMMVLGKTVRFDLSEKEDPHLGWQAMEHFATDRPLCIAVFWHDRILLSTYFWRFSGFAAMVSESFDGEYIARVSQRLGYGIARGSSSRGGASALRKMIGLLKKENFSLALTIDGPRGPRYEVKSGALLLAKTTGVPIVPLLIQPKSFWTMNSWDKLQIPKPFTTAKIFVADAIFISKDSSADDLENSRKEVQRILDELVLRGKQWRDSKK